MAEGVREQICNHVFSSLEAEVGGVLIGRRYADGSPRITDIIAALEAEGARSRVTFTHDAWARIHEILDRDFQSEEILGWYHSHPGFGIFLSEHDLFIHRNFFARPEQIAVVVDPHSGREGVFVWRDGEIVMLAEVETPRPGELPRPAQTAPPQPPRRPVAAMGVYWLLGMLIGLLIWWAFLNDGSGSTSTPEKPHTRTVPAHRADQPPRQPQKASGSGENPAS